MTSFRAARVLLQSRDAVKWRPRDADVLERNTDAVEDFYLHQGSHNVRIGRRRLDLTVMVKLRTDPGFDISVEQTRAAWIALRRRHPAIATYTKGSKRIYQKLQPGQIKRWLNKTLVVIVDQGELTPEVLDSLPAADMPALHFLPRSKVFALRTPQHLMDALGAVMVLNHFLDELSKTAVEPTDMDNDVIEEQPDNLACCLKAAASLPSASIPQRARLWNIRRRWLRNYPSVGIVPDQDGSESGLSSWRELKYSASATKELVAKAKKHKMTVTHVVHAGVAFAAKEYGPFTLTRNYNSVIVVDMRPREASSQDTAVSPKHTLWPISVTVTSFWKTAESVKKAYQDVLSDPDLPALVEPIFAEVFPPSPSACPTFYNAPFVGSCGCIEDCLGPLYRGFTVDDFSLATECSGKEVIVAVWSYQGRLRIRAMFNEGYHSAKSIERYLHLTEVALKNGLGVSTTGD
ncbi:hypothetical protein BDW62DRAFT_220477 [Aspergillus aurantiobrunneus]